MIDGIISRWMPKTSKLGSLPTCVHEPREPVSLGTILKNSSEFKSGIIAHNDVAQNPEMQHRKKHSKEK